MTNIGKKLKDYKILVTAIYWIEGMTEDKFLGDAFYDNFDIYEFEYFAENMPGVKIPMTKELADQIYEADTFELFADWLKANEFEGYFVRVQQWTSSHVCKTDWGYGSTIEDACEHGIKRILAL